MEVTYNCWHGCHKKSEGCLNCYVYRRDNSIGKDASIVYKTRNFNLPIRKNKNGEYKYPSGTTFDMCFSSDFMIEEADAWRKEVLEMIKIRSDCYFMCITKRPERIRQCIPDIESYDNLAIYCTMENQKRFNERMPIYLKSGVRHKGVMIEPMLEKIDMSKYLSNEIEIVSCGGESGVNARVCDFKWVKDVRRQAKEKGIDFYYHQTGAKLIVDGKLYNIKRMYQHTQADKAFKD